MQGSTAGLQGGGAQQGNDADDGSDDEAGFVEDDKTPFVAGPGVEDIMQMLEEGGTLPDIEGLAAAEDSQVWWYSYCHD